MWITEFESETALSQEVSGGKGKNLAELTQAGFAVPPGFIVSPSAYEKFMEADSSLLKECKNLPADNPKKLTTECQKLMQKMKNIEVPAPLHIELSEALKKYPGSTAFSVRSSATAEDLGGAAFAGQHETYLNCIGTEQIISSIKECWISLWSQRAVEYRMQAGTGLMNTSMAVVIQKMVFSEVSGVGFCMNPVSGDPRQMSIDANYGLGETVVGGEYPVDHWVIRKEDCNITDAVIAQKTHQMVPATKEDGNTRIESLDDQKSNAPCLNEKQITELCQLMKKVEKHYGFPQDIEWGMVDGKIWLLQSRPITRIPAKWTRDESAERFPSVISPLAWELVEQGFHQSLDYSFQLMGLPPYHGKWFALFDNYVYGNQNAVEIYAEGMARSLNFSNIQDFMAAIPVLRERYAWAMELPLVWSRDLDRYLLGIGELLSMDIDNYSIQECWDYILKVNRLGAEYFLPNIAISITQRTLYKMVYGIIETAAGKEAAPGIFDKLLAYCETKTGFINKELYQIAKEIASYPELKISLQSSDPHHFLSNGGFSSVPHLEKRFQRFLTDHGHREMEFDPYHPTWLESPWLVVENLKIMLNTQQDDPAEKELTLKYEMAETERQLISRLPEDLRFVLQELLRLTRIYTGLDDIEHYQTTRLTLPIRKGMKALGKLLLKKGVIEDPMDVFFARLEILEKSISNNHEEDWKLLSEAIKKEKEIYSKNKNRSPEWELGVEDKTVSAEDGLKGLPASPGQVSAEVYKVYSQEDFTDFPEGAVLVARTTNPAWTPLFYRAAAVITESGGPLSHGAVTAREVGLPAVMSLRGVMDLLNNGDKIRVDGSNGLIFLEDK